MYFTVLLQESDKDPVAFTWEGEQYTFTQLPQGYWHSATLALYAPAQELAQIGPEEQIKIYQYIDDVLVGCPEVEAVDQIETKLIVHLESLGLHILTKKVHLPSSEVEFLDIWCKGQTTGIPLKHGPLWIRLRC